MQTSLLALQRESHPDRFLDIVMLYKKRLPKTQVSRHLVSHSRLTTTGGRHLMLSVLQMHFEIRLSIYLYVSSIALDVMRITPASIPIPGSDDQPTQDELTFFLVSVLRKVVLYIIIWFTAKTSEEDRQGAI